MTKYILHGGFTRTPNELNRKFMAEVVKDIPDGGQLLIVYFSRNDEEYPKLIEQDKEPFEAAATGKEIKVVVADKGKFVQQLKSSDAIYMRGGETELLMQELEKHPDFGSLVQGKTVAGSSAGAYVLAKYYHSASRGGIHKGLGLVPVRVICHYQSDGFDTPDDPMAVMKDNPEDLRLIVLKDFEYEVIKL
jgi:peptidase E